MKEYLPNNKVYILTSIIPLFILIQSFILWLAIDQPTVNILLPIVVFPALMIYNVGISIGISYQYRSLPTALKMIAIFWVPVLIPLVLFSIIIILNLF